MRFNQECTHHHRGIGLEYSDQIPHHEVSWTGPNRLMQHDSVHVLIALMDNGIDVMVSGEQSQAGRLCTLVPLAGVRRQGKEARYKVRSTP